MKLSVITTVKNEFPWIGYSIMAAEPYVHEFIYTVAADSDDGTIPLLRYLKSKIGPKLKFRISERYVFDPLDRKAYNQAFNDAIEQAEGDACWFLHPDMLVTQGAELKGGPLAWWTNITSYAGDFQTEISKGRAKRWKTIHARTYGLHYFGGYGSQNEDFYHSDITGNAYKHYGEEFSKYPYPVANSGIAIDHYCELKSYSRRLEKMKLCLRAQNPGFPDARIAEMAAIHPRVTLEPAKTAFGTFEFTKTDRKVPEVITRYKEEFEQIKKEVAYA